MLFLFLICLKARWDLAYCAFFNTDSCLARLSSLEMIRFFIVGRISSWNRRKIVRSVNVKHANNGLQGFINTCDRNVLILIVFYVVSN